MNDNPPKFTLPHYITHLPTIQQLDQKNYNELFRNSIIHEKLDPPYIHYLPSSTAHLSALPSDTFPIQQTSNTLSPYENINFSSLKTPSSPPSSKQPPSISTPPNSPNSTSNSTHSFSPFYVIMVVKATDLDAGVNSHINYRVSFAFEIVISVDTKRNNIKICDDIYEKFTFKDKTENYIITEIKNKTEIIEVINNGKNIHGRSDSTLSESHEFVGEQQKNTSNIRNKNKKTTKNIHNKVISKSKTKFNGDFGNKSTPSPFFISTSSLPVLLKLLIKLTSFNDYFKTRNNQNNYYPNNNGSISYHNNSSNSIKLFSTNTNNKITSGIKSLSNKRVIYSNKINNFKTNIMNQLLNILQDDIQNSHNLKQILCRNYKKVNKSEKVSRGKTSMYEDTLHGADVMYQMKNITNRNFFKTQIFKQNVVLASKESVFKSKTSDQKVSFCVKDYTSL